MKNLKVIVISVIVLAIVGSAFAFNAKKIGRFCVSIDLYSTACNIVLNNAKTVVGIPNHYYIVNWNGAACNGVTCTTSAHFEPD
jgi:hypothetical protein